MDFKLNKLALASFFSVALLLLNACAVKKSPMIVRNASHWGLYSQAGGIWKGTRIEDSPYPGLKVAEWLMSTFRIPRAEYEKLAKTFNPDKSLTI